MKAGGKDTYQRAVDEVDRRLAAYRPVSTDPAVDAELQRIIRSGLESQTSLPYLQPAPEPSQEALAAVAAGDGVGAARGRRVNARRRASVE
jgi:hypothetical protein